MFLHLSEPILLTEDGLDGLCTSLNRPVVDVERLPVGPARAAIALHRDGSGTRSLVVALRSVDSGTVALFQFDGELLDSPRHAMDAGLSFAESMGFLFDDDMLAQAGPAGRRRALESWCALTGEELPPPADADVLLEPDVDDLLEPVHDDDRDDPDSMLLLDDLVDLIDDELEVPAPASDESAVRERVQPQAFAAEGAVLSKFRTAPEPQPVEPAADPEAENSQAQLGRIAIVRRRQPDEGLAPLPLLTRLLARF